MTKKQFYRLMKKVREMIMEELRACPDARVIMFCDDLSLHNDVIPAIDSALRRLDDEIDLAIWLREDPLS